MAMYVKVPRFHKLPGVILGRHWLDPLYVKFLDGTVMECPYKAVSKISESEYLKAKEKWKKRNG